MGEQRTIIPAPKWLADRMKKLRKLPPPTLKKIKVQLKASKDFRNGMEPDIGSLDIFAKYGRCKSR